MPESTASENQSNRADEQPDRERTAAAETTATRRHVLSTCAAVAGASLASTGAAATTNHPPQRREVTVPRPGNPVLERGPTSTVRTGSLTGSYDATVDRIVDGAHVVLLIESGGETVGQEVLDRRRYPDVAEGDHVTVWLFRGYLVAVRTG